MPERPPTWRELEARWQDARARRRLIGDLSAGRVSYLAGVLPEHVLRLSAAETLEIYRALLGERLDLALAEESTDPSGGPPAPELSGPAASEPDGSWLKRSNMVGVNVRTAGDFLGVAKYALTLPSHVDAIHLLPLWEPGVVASLYGMASWHINHEFLSAELHRELPHLDTAARQLRALTNLLHAAGRAVGMDVIPHTDRYSEIVLCQPSCFEWVRREGCRILDQSAELHRAVEEAIWTHLRARGAAGDRPLPAPDAETFFGPTLGEEQRSAALFGEERDREGRLARRLEVVKLLHGLGLEPLPATMGPPYRGLLVDERPEARLVDEHGMEWRDYSFEVAGPYSRAFGPLTRYKLYERKDDNARWEIDFSCPREAVWRYVTERYAEQQRAFGFDFMRGDMAHVQMRPGGTPAEPDEFYDILGAVKRAVCEPPHARGFAYLAEVFLAPPGVMTYGDEADHLEAAGAETALGNLQSMPVGGAEFLSEFRRYDDIRRTRGFAPCFAVMTGDKDDPRFDAFYLHGNELRLFVALLLTDMPSYNALGFECRDPHPEPAPNEHYTKLYVFHEEEGPKATHGPYVWGRNAALFCSLDRLRRYVERIWSEVAGRPTRWLIPPDPTGERGVFAWTFGDGLPDQGVSLAKRPAVVALRPRNACPANFVFVANAAPSREEGLTLPPLGSGEPPELTPELSTASPAPPSPEPLVFDGTHYRVPSLAPGEARVYRISGGQLGSRS